MELSKKQIENMVIVNIIHNCTMKIDDNDSEIYIFNEEQFREFIKILTKNILNIQHSYKCLVDEQLNVIKDLKKK